METTHLLVRPAPRYEHAGQWFGSQSSDAPAVAVSPPASQRPPSADAAPLDDSIAREARTFVIGAMTQVLEVVDRRRGVGHLTDLVMPHVIDQVTSLLRACEVAAASGGATPPPVPTAALRRVHIQMCGPAEAEFFGSYVRGARVQAFAGRVEQSSVRVRNEPGAGRYERSKKTELRWRIRSMALG
ncbi:hypothetical protein HH308_03130 [Gordonia sp. TBRC 11910]|uniref:Uncharacterized protein n=1 Tax=Gordonia asplenii TaxID=2725283 RepID=A0A848KTJ4_9ACTN|nr:Rv3235 family protein [Gordonia asplenii]NMO00205.1 hypothetical protein [Gordonia asplenii]